jgi:hypothetical protein
MYSKLYLSLFIVTPLWSARSYELFQSYWERIETHFKLCLHILEKYKLSGALIRQWTIPTERPPFIGEVSVNFSG